MDSFWISASLYFLFCPLDGAYYLWRGAPTYFAAIMFAYIWISRELHSGPLTSSHIPSVASRLYTSHTPVCSRFEWMRLSIRSSLIMTAALNRFHTLSHRKRWSFTSRCWWSTKADTQKCVRNELSYGDATLWPVWKQPVDCRTAGQLTVFYLYCVHQQMDLCALWLSQHDPDSRSFRSDMAGAVCVSEDGYILPQEPQTF